MVILIKIPRILTNITCTILDYRNLDHELKVLMMIEMF